MLNQAWQNGQELEQKIQLNCSIISLSTSENDFPPFGCIRIVLTNKRQSTSSFWERSGKLTPSEAEQFGFMCPLDSGLSLTSTLFLTQNAAI